MLDPSAVQEWGLSATTLEEVFLKLAGSSQMNAAVEGAVEQLGLCSLCRQREAALVSVWSQPDPENGRAAVADGVFCKQCVDEDAAKMQNAAKAPEGREEGAGAETNGESTKGDTQKSAASDWIEPVGHDGVG